MLSLKKIAIGLSIAGVAATTATTINPTLASADNVIGKAKSIHQCVMYDLNGKNTNKWILGNKYFTVNNFGNLPDGTRALVIYNNSTLVRSTCFQSSNGHVIFY